MSRHAGRSVLVTGAASGIGLGILDRFLAEGARVAALDLAPVPREGVLALRGDATDPQVIADAVARTQAAHGRLDVMVNNAGAIAVTPVLEMTDAEWHRILSVNLDSVFLGSRAAARAMVAQGGGGVILNAASGAGRRGVANLSHYCAAKAAIIVFTQALALELAPHRIRANCYAPGHIATPFWEGIAAGFAARSGRTPAEVIEGFRASIPWGRFGTPEDVAAAVAWLASDEAEYVSGQTIAMNGAEFPG